jgi:pilus assembly protein Flp/PilA
MTRISACTTHLRSMLRWRTGDHRGASLVEYALLLGLIALVCVGAVTLIGETTSAKLSETGSYFR